MMRVIIFLVFFLHSFDGLAEISVYTIEGKIQAAFPASPKFVGEAGQGNQRHRSYQLVDDKNALVYAVTWQLGKTKFRSKDIAEAIRYYAKGDAFSTRGKLVSIEFVQINVNKGAHYIIDYRLGDLPVRKYTAVVYRDGHFYSWSVQEFPGVSRISAADIFRSYVRYFSLK